MPNQYTPLDWYWQDEAGRVYSSARHGEVSVDDTDYAAWVEAGNEPTAWPKDDAGAQSGAALASTLSAAGIAFGLAGYAAQKRYAIETGGITFAGGRVATDRESQAMINGAFNLAKDDPATTIKFKSGAGFATLTAEQVIALGRAVAAHVQACFAAEAAVLEAISATPAVVSSAAEIDAYAWPSNS